MNLQNAAIVVSLLIGGGGLGLGLLNFFRDAERYRVSRRPDIRIGQWGVFKRPGGNGARVGADAHVSPGPTATRLCPEVGCGGEICGVERSHAVASGGRRRRMWVNIPNEWLENPADDPLRLRSGVVGRVFDEHSGAEDSITIE